MNDGIRKRSVTIGGHATSYSVEDEFFAELSLLASREGCSVAALVGRIDAARPPGRNLSSAIRVYVLQALKQQS